MLGMNREKFCYLCKFAALRGKLDFVGMNSNQEGGAKNSTGRQRCYLGLVST